MRTIDSFINFDPTFGVIPNPLTLPVRFKATVSGSAVLVLDIYIANKLGGTSIKQLPEDWQIAILQQINAEALEQDANFTDFDARR
jgi:hypothetical protein